MIGFDFEFFWQAARAILADQSPYTVSGFFSPLPFVWIMLPLGFLPFWGAFSIWTGLNLISLLYIGRKNTPRLLLFLPVLYALWVGQVDLIIFAAGLFGGWIGLAFTALKPQLAIWLLTIKFIEWWRLGERKKIVLTLFLILLLYGIPSVIQPGWWQEWFNATPTLLTYSEHASSLFGLAALLPIPSIQTFLGVSLLAGLSFLLLKPYKASNYWNWVAIFNPVANIYSLCLVIAQADWVAIILSWVLLPLSLFLHTGLPWVIIPIYLWWRSDHQAKSKLMVANF